MPQTQPNILLVTVDEWPGALLGCAGHPVVETPTLDALARSGVRYDRAYSECPVCVPARRTLMTGASPKAHGDRIFQGTLPMPADMETLPARLSRAGYQTFAVGKMHVYPPRARIGFDDVILAEEGRQTDGLIDDYELFLADRGYAGQQFMHGMGNNEYVWRPWHLPEDVHPTNWTTFTAARTIKRRDPTRPGFWYVSYTHPHPPLTPLRDYLDRYAGKAMDAPARGDWVDGDALPEALRHIRAHWNHFSPEQLADIRRAFYALCTHIDHQLRILVGTLREEGLLDDTIILFTSDHGDMLGDHGLFAKRLMYENSARVPMILSGGRFTPDIVPGSVDSRLVGLQDVMPTLLALAGVSVPESSTGLDMTGAATRPTLYGECTGGLEATRMIHDGRHKLIWYPAGNVVQLFDVAADPRDEHDLADVPAMASIRQRLTAALVAELYGEDLDWVREGELVGFTPQAALPTHHRTLYLQRGLQYPPARPS